MGLDSVWREIKERDFVESHKELKLITPRKIQNPINRLKGNLRWNFIFGIIGIIAFSAIVISYSALSIRITMGILILKSIYFNYKVYQRIKSLHNLSNERSRPILDILQIQLSLIRKTIQMIELRTMLFMPLAYLAGLLIGGSRDGVDADELIMNSSYIFEGLAKSFLTLPPLYFGIKWMHKKSFGDHICHIEEIISSSEDTFKIES